MELPFLLPSDANLADSDLFRMDRITLKLMGHVQSSKLTRFYSAVNLRVFARYVYSSLLLIPLDGDSEFDGLMLDFSSNATFKGI